MLVVSLTLNGIYRAKDIWYKKPSLSETQMVSRAQWRGLKESSYFVTNTCNGQLAVPVARWGAKYNNSKIYMIAQPSE